MARITTCIGSTTFSATEDGHTTVTSPRGTVELAPGQTYTDPDTGAQVTARAGGLNIVGNVTGGLSGNFG
ncbi:hypothetical protein MTQ13_03100 [Streptomyces sp. XM4011]|uniref:hypothetical protein n=1 Tax=Streptomyces sp. XM4011 TaxID=2929780 RepID=UPI001FF87FA9|nr:hypothetical protein [Streptomyces sp. XM4011]MCK1813268.1 hypothetical protein [Streptomyces sp. XM4011]